MGLLISSQAGGQASQAAAVDECLQFGIVLAPCLSAPFPVWYHSKSHSASSSQLPASCSLITAPCSLFPAPFPWLVSELSRLRLGQSSSSCYLVAGCWLLVVGSWLLVDNRTIPPEHSVFDHPMMRMTGTGWSSCSAGGWIRTQKEINIKESK